MANAPYELTRKEFEQGLDLDYVIETLENCGYKVSKEYALGSYILPNQNYLSPAFSFQNHKSLLFKAGYMEEKDIKMGRIHENVVVPSLVRHGFVRIGDDNKSLIVGEKTPQTLKLIEGWLESSPHAQSGQLSVDFCEKDGRGYFFSLEDYKNNSFNLIKMFKTLTSTFPIYHYWEDLHQLSIESALYNGKTVPRNVLKEYNIKQQDKEWPSVSIKKRRVRILKQTLAINKEPPVVESSLPPHPLDLMERLPLKCCKGCKKENMYAFASVLSPAASRKGYHLRLQCPVYTCQNPNMTHFESKEKMDEFFGFDVDLSRIRGIDIIGQTMNERFLEEEYRRF